MAQEPLCGGLCPRADQLGQVIASGDPDRAKALLRILIAELRVNSRSEVLPTYRVGAPVVCAQASSVGANRDRTRDLLPAQRALWTEIVSERAPISGHFCEAAWKPISAQMHADYRRLSAF